jgi:hypothetical protein
MNHIDNRRQWEEVAAACNVLFLEARHFEMKANDLFARESDSAETLLQYSEAKQVADAKYAEARSMWARAKQEWAGREKLLKKETPFSVYSNVSPSVR